MGDVEFFDGANGVSRQLKRVLEEKDLISDAKDKGNITFIDSSCDEKIREEKKKRFLTAQDVMEMLGVLLSYSYKLIRRLNAEFEADGFVTIKGRR